MAHSIDDLRTVLVDHWSVLDKVRWKELVGILPDPVAMLHHLATQHRFTCHAAPGFVPFLTSEMKTAIDQGLPGELLHKFGSETWLRLRKLGEGTYGEVWLACRARPDADRLYAMKVPKPGIHSATWTKEIKNLEKLGACDNLIRLVAANRSDGTIITGYIDGQNLEKHAASIGQFPVAEAVRIGIGLCRAIEHLHGKRIIHKDIKPLNIVMETFNGRLRPVLIDLGLAEDHASAVARLAGSPFYIAPEVFDLSKKPNVRADLYSLGATLFRLLSGYPPHIHRLIHPRKDISTQAVLDHLRFRHVDSSLDCDLEEIRRDVPRQLAGLVCRCLNPDPNLRPASAAIMRAELEQLDARFAEAIRIDSQLNAFQVCLLEAIRGLFQDDAYKPEQIWLNAENIHAYLARNIPRFSILTGLDTPTDPMSWVGIPSVFPMLPRIAKLVRNVVAFEQQLKKFLDRNKANQSTAQGLLLNDLIVRTLEGMRVAFIETLSALHEWRSTLRQLGIGG
jgi:serine/threonine protein kinase